MHASGLWTTARTQGAREIAIPHNKHAHPPDAHTHTLPTFMLRVNNPSPNVKKKQDQHAAPLRNGDGDDDGDADDDAADDDDEDEEEDDGKEEKEEEA